MKMRKVFGACALLLALTVVGCNENKSEAPASSKPASTQQSTNKPSTSAPASTTSAAPASTTSAAPVDPEPAAPTWPDACPVDLTHGLRCSGETLAQQSSTHLLGQPAHQPPMLMARTTHL